MNPMSDFDIRLVFTETVYRSTKDAYTLKQLSLQYNIGCLNLSDIYSIQEEYTYTLHLYITNMYMYIYLYICVHRNSIIDDYKEEPDEVYTLYYIAFLSIAKHISVLGLSLIHI